MDAIRELLGFPFKSEWNKSEWKMGSGQCSDVMERRVNLFTTHVRKWAVPEKGSALFSIFTHA